MDMGAYTWHTQAYMSIHRHTWYTWVFMGMHIGIHKHAQVCTRMLTGIDGACIHRYTQAYTGINRHTWVYIVYTGIDGCKRVYCREGLSLSLRRLLG